MKVNSSEKILSTTDLSNLTYSAGSTCSDYSWVKKKAASKKTPACSCRNKSTWKRTFTGKVAFKTQVQRTGLGIAHNPTRWNYTTQEFPPLVKLTPLPPQALLPRGDPNSTDQRTSGLQPCFELGPPTIREIATNTKPTQTPQTMGPPVASSLSGRVAKSWQVPPPGKQSQQRITSSTQGERSTKLQLELPW